MSRLLLVLVLIVFVLKSNAYFRHIGTEDGLPSGEINCFAQDSTGNMWFATWTGLIRYDGFQFKTFRPCLGDANSIPDKKVKRLLVDSKGSFWVATEEHLCRYNQQMGNFTTFKFNRKETNLTNHLNISDLIESSGLVIISTVEGLFAISIGDVATNEDPIQPIQVYQDGSEIQFYYNIVSKTANQFVFVSNGVGDYNTRMVFAHFVSRNGKIILEVDRIIYLKQDINALEYLDRENAFYIASGSGISKFSLNSYTFDERKSFPNQSIRDLIATQNHLIYCVTAESNLLYLDLHTGATGTFAPNPNQPHSLLNSNIMSLFEDFSGNLWIGHQGQGISVLNLNQKEFYTYRKNYNSSKPISSNAVMCFGSTQDVAFIGCRSGGLNVLDRKDFNTENAEFKALPLVRASDGQVVSGGIWDIKRESDSIFWVATDAGLYQLNRSSHGWNLSPFGTEPIFRVGMRSIFIDPNKSIWCGTMRNGIVFIPRLGMKAAQYYNFDSRSNDSTSLSDNVVLTFLLDSKNRFWVGTNNGLNLLEGRFDNLDLSGKVCPAVKFKRFVATKPVDNYINNNEINSIFENFDNSIWIGTQGGGINVYNDQSRDFSHITEGQGLPSNDVLGILSDELGNLWISTAKGLVSYNQHIEHPSFTRYGSSDGIQGDMFMINSYHRALDGELYFGGENGFTRFYPSRIKPNTIRPKISFTYLKIHNKAIEVGDTLKGGFIMSSELDAMSLVRLPYSQNSLAVGVAAIHFQYPEGNYFAYHVENFRDSWIVIPASEQFIYLSNLPSGKYTLMVKAISSDNVESENIRTIQIEINPPWYLTWYMNAIFLILALTIITSGVVYIINRQRQKYLQRIAAITIETNESKMSFLANIAHELRTPLSLVIAPIEDLMLNATSFDQNWQNHLLLIHRNSNYLLKLINQIIDFRKLNEGKLKLVKRKADMGDLINEVVSNFSSYQTTRMINIVTHLPKKSIVTLVDVQKIEEIMYNLLSNAFKHTAKYCSIEVGLQLIQLGAGEPDHIRISVFNEGKDIPDQEKKRVFERFYKTDETIDGAGIGLAFSKSLIEMHNGTIWVESIKDKGVIFYVQFPMEMHEIGAEISSTEVWADRQKDGDELGKDFFLNDQVVVESDVRELKIMIVEDNEELRKFLVTVLNREYTCIEARDGKEAWELIVDHIPDVIISDVIMPRMDGYELCKLVKEDMNTCHIPFIMLTAKNSNENAIEGYNSGVDAYVTKPFDIQVIMSQLARLIKNRELIREKYKKQNFMVEVSTSNPSKDDEFLSRVRSLLDDNLMNTDFNVKEMSILLEMSTTQLYRKIKSLTGYSPVEFMRIARLHKAHDMLKLQKYSIKEVCYLTGFNNLSYFVKCFREYFGVTPANYRDKGLNQPS